MSDNTLELYVEKELYCNLTADEKVKFSQALAEYIVELEKVESEKRTLASRAKVLDEFIGTIAENVDRGSIKRMVQCSQKWVQGNTKIEVRRQDTYEVVCIRDPTFAEKQLELPGTDEKNTPPPTGQDILQVNVKTTSNNTGYIGEPKQEDNDVDNEPENDDDKPLFFDVTCKECKREQTIGENVTNCENCGASL